MTNQLTSNTETLLNRDQASQLLQEIGVYKTDDVSRRLFGLSDDFSHVTVEAVGKMSKSMVHQFYIAEHNAWVSDQVQNAIEAVRDDSDSPVLTSEAIVEIAGYMDCNLKKPLMTAEQIDYYKSNIPNAVTTEVGPPVTTTFDALSPDQQMFIQSVYEGLAMPLPLDIDVSSKIHQSNSNHDVFDHLKDALDDLDIGSEITL